MRIPCTTSLALTMAALSLPAEAADAANDIRAGHDIAVTTCIACHDVSTHQALTPIFGGQAPSFESIAKRKDTTEEGLRRFLSDKHWDDRTLAKPATMYLLRESQKTQVIAYIMSLRQ